MDTPDRAWGGRCTFFSQGCSLRTCPLESLEALSHLTSLSHEHTRQLIRLSSYGKGQFSMFTKCFMHDISNSASPHLLSYVLCMTVL